MLLKKKKNSSPNKRDELAHILDRRWTQAALSLAGIHGNSTGDCQYIHCSAIAILSSKYEEMHVLGCNLLVPMAKDI